MVREVAVLSMSDDDRLIRVKARAICHTGLDVIEGDLSQKKSPLTPGHQIVGLIEKIGKNVFSFISQQSIAVVEGGKNSRGRCFVLSEIKENQDRTYQTLRVARSFMILSRRRPSSVGLSKSTPGFQILPRQALQTLRLRKNMYPLRPISGNVV